MTNNVQPASIEGVCCCRLLNERISHKSHTAPMITQGRINKFDGSRRAHTLQAVVRLLFLLSAACARASARPLCWVSIHSIIVITFGGSVDVDCIFSPSPTPVMLHDGEFSTGYFCYSPLFAISIDLNVRKSIQQKDACNFSFCAISSFGALLHALRVGFAFAWLEL